MIPQLLNLVPPHHNAPQSSLPVASRSTMQKRATPPIGQGGTHTTPASTSSGRGAAESPVAIVVDALSSPCSAPSERNRGRHHPADAARPNPVLIPAPPGAASSSQRRDSTSPQEDGEVIVVGSAANHDTVHLSTKTVDVPPSAVLASRYRNIYDGSLLVPPGTTKRALGRMRLFYCCVLTEESWHTIFIAAPILIFTAVFVAFVVPRGEWFSYVFCAVFATGSLTCLTLCVTMDPGIVPPAPLPEQPAGPMTVLVDGKMVECKVCTTCHILRPPRSTHCKFCDVCVEEFDHHCGILGSCVGKRTFRFFGGFFIITSFLAAYVLVRSFIIVTTTDFKDGNEDLGILLIATGCVLCILAAMLGGCLVVPCAVRYIMLSATNETTKETMRQEQQGPDAIPGCAPVPEMRSENYVQNLVHRLFSPIGRSRIPFDYYV